MSGISDTTMSAVEFALQGVARRSDVLSQNIANADTPNYRSRTVDFESHLRRAIDDGRFDQLRGASVELRNGLPNQHGNDVDLEADMVGLIKNNLMQDAMVASYNFKVNVLRSALGRG